MTPNQIKTLRKKLGMSMNEFASALGFTGKYRATTVYRLEVGERNPGGGTLMLLKQLKEKSKLDMETG